ncbi:hypothetical protein AArcSl_0221 [Halalkaliarchaeum desulfuricum]|uniref:Uncharacterized protein n=1 Tax=Halalkaliarchaeum desulfuricum TaxID=2055893 RepID=A0A343TFK4_9EURY|nr:DUF5810 domain-containing protein [Halalkaliarchaeum desulfuricum]AUX07876.1 hypothetical protein AArcSl_0221 [Halalkaliarchaeum desulfuricum]
MGYACPVCVVKQPDGEHLAHHLAFTAMLHGDEHETWLDEHAPGWENCGPEELAETVVEDAPEADVPDVDHAHSHGESIPAHDRRTPAGRGGGFDDEAASVLQEAQALTRAMMDDEEEKKEEEDDGDAGGNGDSDTHE